MYPRLAGQQPSLQLLLEHVFASCRYDVPDLDDVSVRLTQPSQLLTIPVRACHERGVGADERAWIVYV